MPPTNHEGLVQEGNSKLGPSTDHQRHTCQDPAALLLHWLFGRMLLHCRYHRVHGLCVWACTIGVITVSMAVVTVSIAVITEYIAPTHTYSMAVMTWCTTAVVSSPVYKDCLGGLMPCVQCHAYNAVRTMPCVQCDMYMTAEVTPKVTDAFLCTCRQTHPPAFECERQILEPFSVHQRRLEPFRGLSRRDALSLA
jgi:hypothetical protein